MNAIPWIAASAKSEDGFERTKGACEWGDVWVVEDKTEIVSTMTLVKDSIAAACGYNIWLIRLIATAKSAQRKGYARLLLRKGKEIVDDGVLTAYIQNEDSLALVRSEGFALVDGQTDAAGYPLYEWIHG